LLVSVPATIITSDWRGEARKMMPKRSWSYLGVDRCIISTAQHASPNVMGHNEPVGHISYLAQLIGSGGKRALTGPIRYLVKRGSAEWSDEAD